MNSITKEQNYKLTNIKPKLKDPGSAITHGIALILCVAGIAPILNKTLEQSNIINLIALSIYMFTMTLSYFASKRICLINNV